jgi:alpha-mannosidase
MALAEEWSKRITHWRNELPRHFYRAMGEIPMCAFFTYDQLTFQQARHRTFRPIAPGTRWGKLFEYGWFRGEITLPADVAGQRIVLAPDVGAEGLVFVNGRAKSSRDHAHTHILLSPSARSGRSHEILIEASGGHGPHVHVVGPVPLDRESVRMPVSAQAVTGESTFGAWNENAYQLWIDVETLWHLRNALDINSLRVAELDAGLRDFSIMVDFESGEDALDASARAARKRLAPLLACKNGSTAPVFYLVGHAHLDVAWFWPLAETERKIARTVTNQLALMAEYPEYRYLQSQPHLYRMLKDRYPEVYRRVKAAVKRGRIIPEGGMWVEADVNLAGGESLVRQFIHGMRFFRREFGVRCEILWLPDVFGYCGQLPQIMRGCGIRYFTTAKILWAYNAAEKFPHTTFWWEGIDGSRIPSHLLGTYGGFPLPSDLVRNWNNRRQHEGVRSLLYAFGHGDGGGGATRDMLELVRRQKDLEGSPRTVMTSPVAFFKDLEKRGFPDIAYVGELYFTAHRGSYTSQANVKKGNRRSEMAMREAEMWACAAQVLSRAAIPLRELDSLWKTVLLNQFHDILPGSAGNCVYKEAAADHARVIDRAGRIAHQAMRKLVRASSKYTTVFNSLSWKRDALVALPHKAWGARLPGGTMLPVQRMNGATFARITVPPCGWSTLLLDTSARRRAPGPGASASPNLLENEFLRARINARGEIKSLIDKQTGRELTAGACNAFRMYRDVPADWDAWDINSMYARTPVELPGPASISVVSDGPLVAALRVSRALHQSSLTQEIVLRAGSRRMDFKTVIRWNERHKLLKVNFPVAVHANEAVHDIQFGFIRRSNHLSRPHDADRFEVPQHKWTALAEESGGCAVLNDCKYGVNVLGNSINLSLLRAPVAPDPVADRGVHEFTYSLYSWNGPLVQSRLIQEAYDLNVPCQTAEGNGGERSLFSLTTDAVVIEAVKPAEDGSGDIVLRLYEALQTHASCTLATSLPVKLASLTDMLESAIGRLTVRNNAIALEFRPFEIKTIRLHMR